MHSAPILGLLSVASYTLATPLNATPKPDHIVRQAASTTQDVSVIQITIPAVTPIHGDGSSPASQADQTIKITVPTCTMTAVPDQNGYVPPGTCHSYYDYYPSFAAALVFTLFFAVLTIAHITQAAVYKKPFCWVICMAAVWELGAFFTRTLSTKNQQSVGLVFVSEILVLLAPLWVNAFDYMLFARMIHFFMPSKRLLGIKAGTFAIVFVVLDVVAFFIQLIGGTTAGPSDPPDQQLKGIHIYMGGIGLQEFFIVCFVGLVIKFQIEVQSSLNKYGSLTMAGASGAWDGKARRLLYTLYASLAFITIRIIWRLIEHSQPPSATNSFLVNESYFYVLEAVPMFFAIGILNFTHPGTVLKGPESNLPKSTLWRRCACCCGAGKRKKAQQSSNNAARYLEIEELALTKSGANMSPSSGHRVGEE